MEGYSSKTRRSHPMNEYENENENENAVDMATSFSDPLRLPLLTILLPAYNEQERILPTIQTYRSYLETWNVSNLMTTPSIEIQKIQILVVDDGSTDHTVQQVLPPLTPYQPSDDKNTWSSISTEDQKCISPRTTRTVPVHCISLPYNQGKGAAISHGIQHILHSVSLSFSSSSSSSFSSESLCPGRRKDRLPLNPRFQDTLGDILSQCGLIFVADADGSGNIASIDRMMQRMMLHLLEFPTFSDLYGHDVHSHRDDLYFFWNRPLLINGIRTMTYHKPSLDTSHPLQNHSSRQWTRWGFRSVVRIICGDLQVQDTQCGLKLMTAYAGFLFYSNLHLPRWTHDVEVFYRASKLKYANRKLVQECEIEWKDIPEGSKLIRSRKNSSLSSRFLTILDIVRVSVQMLLEVLWMKIMYTLGIWKMTDVSFLMTTPETPSNKSSKPNKPLSSVHPHSYRNDLEFHPHGKMSD